MVDIIEKNGVVNIKNSSGGGILLDGKKPITEDEVINVLNKRYPIGSKYIFPTGSENPASDIGGDWTLIASNVNLPLGTKSEVYGSGALRLREIGTGKRNVEMQSQTWSDSKTTPRLIGVGSSGSLSGWNTMQIAGKGDSYPSGVYADLTTSNAITVDIWERIG